MHGTSPDTVQVTVAVPSQGFLVYRIYVCMSPPASCFPIYSQPLSQREEHCYTSFMGKEFAHTTSVSFA